VRAECFQDAFVQANQGGASLPKPAAEVGHTSQQAPRAVLGEALFGQRDAESVDVWARHAAAQVAQRVRVLEEVLDHAVLLGAGMGWRLDDRYAECRGSAKADECCFRPRLAEPNSA
jgi:hypothetical protein